MFKGWRTIVWNLLNIAVLVMDQFTAVVPDEYNFYWGLVYGLVNIGLRFITTTPVGQKM